MTIRTAQSPLQSGFGPKSTAAEVVADLDLSGKLAIVTGGSSGLGLETTRALAGAGATVLVPARHPDDARASVSDLAGVEVHHLDLSDLGSVRTFAGRFLDSGRHVDILINNAGIMACPETRVGPGWEAQLAVNHLGHFALTRLLWPALVGGSRVVAVSSGAHGITPMRWGDPHFNKGYEKWTAYGQSKTANVLFSAHLDAIGQDAGIRAFSLHPGSILTPLQRHLSQKEMVDAGWIDEGGRLIDQSFKSAPQGAATQVWAATSPLLADKGGVYCEHCDIARASDKGPGVRPHAIDRDEAAKLWEYSTRLVDDRDPCPSR